MNDGVALLIAALAGYFIGSIPFGLILTRLTGYGDIRSLGSGNIGATNVLRTGNKKLAAATLFFDMAKGTAAVVMGALLGNLPAIIAGCMALIGHCFPVWLRFKGGKGVATFLGILLGLFWPAALLFSVVWLVSAKITRYSSLSALIATAIVPLGFLAFNLINLAISSGFLCIIIWWRHRANIIRLIHGHETRIGEKG